MGGDFPLGAGEGVEFAGFGHALAHIFDFGVGGCFEVDAATAPAVGAVGLEGFVHFPVEGAAAAWVSLLC